MNGPPELVFTVRQWVEKAEHDLTAAQLLLNAPDNCPYDVVCFHVQQWVEKCMKALLVSLSITFPKTHDLRKLFDLMPDSAKKIFNLEDLLLVNRYAIDARYPGDYDPIGRRDAQRAVKIAVKLKKKISSLLLP
jgi:HEPN domain-containing protein